MRRFYQATLRLYPSEYRATFAPEILHTLELATTEHRARGRVAFLSFTVCELGGVLRGLFAEWVAKWLAHEAYITSRCSTRNVSDVPPEVAEVQNRLDRALASMEFAIAHHDFPKARFYSNEERETRAQLQQLILQYKLERPIDGCA